MRAFPSIILLLFAIMTTACGRQGAKPDAVKGPELKEGTTPETIGPVRDFAEYVADLKKNVPVRVTEFKAKGFRCDPYATTKLADIEIFDSLTLLIEPVYLRDSLSGKTKKYTGAKMFRSDNGDVFATGTEPGAEESRKRGFIPITWHRVTMISEDEFR